jgi:hypothetical protein
MNTHVKLVAIFHIVLGALSLVAAMIIFAVFGTMGGVVAWHGQTAAAGVVGFVALCIGGLIALHGVPGIIGGWALLTRKSWARVMMIVLGVLDLLHFPLGTVLGVYTLWVMFRSDLITNSCLR